MSCMPTLSLSLGVGLGGFVNFMNGPPLCASPSLPPYQANQLLSSSDAPHQVYSHKHLRFKYSFVHFHHIKNASLY